MSNHDNHRRGETKRTENGPRWEHGGSDNSAVARARKAWKKRANRKERRTGSVSPKVMLQPRSRPSTEEDGPGPASDAPFPGAIEDEVAP